MPGDDAKLSLRALRESALFWPTLPARRLETWAERAIAKEDTGESHRIGAAATAAVPNWQVLADHARALGRLRTSDAVPTLALLWRGCAVQPVRVQVGHALRNIGTPEARAVLISMIDDADHLSTFLGVRAAFDGDPMGAFDRFAPRFEDGALGAPGGDAVPRIIVTTFVPSSYARGRSVFSEARAPAWFRDDLRWMELCVRMRRDPRVGDVARKALRSGDPALVDEAIRRAIAVETPREIVPAVAARGDRVARYERGEHEAVWQELRAHEHIAGALREEAIAVGRATMKRVRDNVELLAKRLSARGWTSLDARVRGDSSSSLWCPPAPDDETMIADIERTIGAPLPPSLVTFFRIVGGVDFVWDYERADAAPSLGPALDMTAQDPITVSPVRDLRYVLDEWKEAHDGIDPEIADPYELPLASDVFQKANTSGGQPYGVVLPFGGADPIFANEAHGLPFVSYLRWCLAWGGFPLLEAHAARADVQAFVREMTADFQPF